MRKIVLSMVGMLMCLALVLPLTAQEGFPLKGTWLGDWGEGTNRNQVFVVFDWDGKVISGAINPGTETVVLKNASLTPTPVAPPAGAAAPAPRGQGAGAAPAAGGAPALTTGGGQGGGRQGNGAGQSVAAPPVEWIVHFEGEGKDAKGAAVHYVVDGKIENIGLYNRSLSGTWVSGSTKGTFKISRQ